MFYYAKRFNQPLLEWRISESGPMGSGDIPSFMDSESFDHKVCWDADQSMTPAYGCE